MAQQLQAGLPFGLELDGGYTIRVTAIDPTTGNLISGVKVSNVAITAEEPPGSPNDLANSGFTLETGVPLLVPGPG